MGSNENPELEYIVKLQKIIEALEKELSQFKRKERQLAYAMKSLDDNPDGVFWSNTFGRLLYVNEAACNQLGYSKEELLNMTLADIDAKYPKEIWDPDSEFMKAAKCGKTAYLQTLHRHRDGHLIPVEIVNSVLESEGEGMICSIVRDITGRVRAEEEQKELYEMLNREIEEHKRTEEMLRKANFELEKSACTDQLTGVWNRRFFLNTAEVEIKRARRYKHSMSLLLLDIDHFKSVNDRYGHQVGDEVLVDLTTVLKAGIRDTDLLTRWGGEEFIVLALQMGTNGAAQLAERLRVLIGTHNFNIDDMVTVSIGIAEFNYKDNLDAWIKKADDALYMAKKSGRNRVEISKIINSPDIPILNL